MNLLEYSIARTLAQLREKPALTPREKTLMDVIVPVVQGYEQGGGR